jgi:hypothetical protein
MSAASLALAHSRAGARTLGAHAKQGRGTTQPLHPLLNCASLILLSRFSHLLFRLHS